MLALLLSLIAVQQAPAPAAITVELNHDQFDRGDKARVYLQTAQDGYLIVLHADPDGRVRVLFPLDPTEDDFVRGGRRLELRSRSDRDAFIIEADEGSGMVLAAWSADAFNHTEFVRNDHWDYRSLSAGTVKDDPLVILLDIVRTMAGASRFEYDAVSYVISEPIAARYSFGYGSDWGYYPHYSVGIGYGYWYGPYYDPFCWDPFWSRCYGFGYGYPYYRPYRYSYYRPYWYGGGWGGRTGGKYAMPDRNRDRFAPVEPRRRSGAQGGSGFVIRDRQATRRSVEPRARDGDRSSIAPRERSTAPRERSIAPRERSTAPRDRGVAPRDRSSTPRVTPSQPRSSGSGNRPSVSRGSNGGSRPSARPAPSGGGRRSGGSGGGGRRS